MLHNNNFDFRQCSLFGVNYYSQTRYKILKMSSFLFFSFLILWQSNNLDMGGCFLSTAKSNKQMFF